MHRFLKLAILFALTLRSLLPVGFMLGTTEAGSTAIVICTGHGMLTVKVDDHGHPTPAKPQHDTLCPYASTGATALNSLPAVPVIAMRYTHAAYPVARALWRPAFGAAAAHPRAPPLPV